MLLDAVLANPDLAWLASERDKLASAQERLGKLRERLGAL